MTFLLRVQYPQGLSNLTPGSHTYLTGRRRLYVRKGLSLYRENIREVHEDFIRMRRLLIALVDAANSTTSNIKNRVNVKS